MVKFSPCVHCQTDNNESNALECMSCNFHPWRYCYHPDCNKLPPIKHEPVRSRPPSPPTPPEKEEQDSEKDREKDEEKDAENEKRG